MWTDLNQGKFSEVKSVEKKNCIPGQNGDAFVTVGLI